MVDVDGWVYRVGRGFDLADHDRAAWPLEFWRRARGVGKVLQPLVAGELISMSIRPGSAYAGEIIINLPDFLTHFGFSLRTVRKWAGLSAYLNHIKYTNLPSHFIKVGLVTSIPIILYKWYHDVAVWQEKKGSISRLASAVAVDAGLTLGTTVGATWAGAQAGLVVGAAIGSVVPGLGTVVGGSAGAIIGGIAGGIAATWVVDHYDLREQLISQLDEHVFSPIGRVIARGVDAVSNWVDEAARQMQQQFDSISKEAQMVNAMFRRDVSRGAQDVMQAIRNVRQDTDQAVIYPFLQRWQGVMKPVNEIESVWRSLSHADRGSNVIDWIKPYQMGYGFATIGGAAITFGHYYQLTLGHFQGRNTDIPKSGENSSSSSTPSTMDRKGTPVENTSLDDVLSQKEPKGDQRILELHRVTDDQKHEEINPFTGQPIKTVRDHIKAYGCLLTSYVMLLRHYGYNVSVTDMYKSLYESVTGNNFDEDAKGGEIVLANLYAPDSIISKMTRQEMSVETGHIDGNTSSLVKAVQAHGPLVMQVSTGNADGHWIVVDGYDEKNGFIIRDPLQGSVTTKIPGRYKLLGPIKYLTRNTRQQGNGGQ